MNRPLVIGLGNRWRGDDGAGPLVLDALRGCGLAVDLLENPGDSLSLINAWQGREQVYVVDACCDVALAAGTVITIDEALTDTATLSHLRHPTSSHVLDVRQAIELSQALGSAPQKLTVFAIASSQFEQGAEPSPAVKAAASDLAIRLGDLLGHRALT